MTQAAMELAALGKIHESNRWRPKEGAVELAALGKIHESNHSFPMPTQWVPSPAPALRSA